MEIYVILNNRNEYDKLWQKRIAMIKKTDT